MMRPGTGVVLSRAGPAGRPGPDQPSFPYGPCCYSGTSSNLSLERDVPP